MFPEAQLMVKHLNGWKQGDRLAATLGDNLSRRRHRASRPAVPLRPQRAAHRPRKPPRRVSLRPGEQRPAGKPETYPDRRGRGAGH